MLSVSGARGLVGLSMTPAVAQTFAFAFGSFVKSQSQAAEPLICLGRDSRPSGPALAEAATIGLRTAGCGVIDLGVVATPTVAVMINHHQAAGGMVITASHNPVIWNGLKCLNSDGVAPPASDAQQIIDRFRELRSPPRAPFLTTQMQMDLTSNQLHVERVLACVNVNAIRAARLRIVLDSVNGAGCDSGRMLLEALGCELVHINGQPHGHFAHTPEPVRENLTELCHQTRAANAACGFAQDPDADRLAIVDEMGTFIGEEYTLVLAAKQMLERAGQKNANSIVLTANLSTSRMIDDLAAAHSNVQVVRTAVGEANVVAAMKAAGKDRAIIGGEGNGGVILPHVCWVRDSLSAMALVLEMLAISKHSLSAIVDQLPRYQMIKHKFDLASLGGIEAVRPILHSVAQRFAGFKISTIDGVRIDFPPPDVGWVHLRPSNTEPIVRLIAEAKTEQEAWALINSVATVAGLK